MKTYKYISLCFLCILMAGCIGGIDTNGGGVVGAPTVVAAPGNAETFVLWTPDPDNPGDSYELNRDDEQIFDGSATTYNDTGLTNGTRVCYTVTAVNGEARATSTEACATPMADVALAITNQSLSALLNWAEVAGASAYHIYVLDPVPVASLSKEVSKATGDPPIVVAGPPYTLTGLSNCANYPVKVLPVDVDGQESESEVSYIDAEPTTFGELDTSFGTNGIVVEGAVIGYFYDIALLSDGGIAAVQQNNLTATSNLYIYDNNGSLNDVIDLTGDPSIDITRANSLVIDENDNIFVAGRDDDMRVCKFDSEGVLDTTFGQIANPGCYYFGVPPSRATDILIHSSGDLVLTGSQSVGGDPAFKIWRLTSDGALVWQYTYSVPGDEYRGEAVAVQGDRIVAAGEDSTVAVDRLMVISVDSSGGDEQIVFNSGAGSVTLGHGITAAPDGSVVVTGQTLSGAGQLFLPMWNYTTDLSSVDFYTYTLTTGAGLGSSGFDIQYDCRDRIVATGVNQGVSVGFVAMRADDAFNIDTSFGNLDPLNGWFLYDGGVAQLGSSITQDDLGRIYAAGIENDGANDHPILMRLQ